MAWALRSRSGRRKGIVAGVLLEEGARSVGLGGACAGRRSRDERGDGTEDEEDYRDALAGDDERIGTVKASASAASLVSQAAMRRIRAAGLGGRTTCRVERLKKSMGVRPDAEQDQGASLRV